MRGLWPQREAKMREIMVLLLRGGQRNYRIIRRISPEGLGHAAEGAEERVRGPQGEGAEAGLTISLLVIPRRRRGIIGTTALHLPAKNVSRDGSPDPALRAG